MTILVLSDSHGCISNMELAVEKVSPDMIFHLGDCWADAEALREQYPHIPFHHVPGNCDFRPLEAAEELLCVQGVRILLCHGHTYGVKQTLLRAGYRAQEADLDLFLFGHTHMPLVDKKGKTWFVNPGSIGRGARPTYATITIEDGKLNPHTAFLY